MTFISYAQNFEDVMLWRAFRSVHRGFYIDVGAAHPDIDSVTRAFYDRGWSGINLEPVHELHARLCAARPRDVNLCLAASNTAAQGTVFVVPGTGLSTTDSTLAVQHGAAGYDPRSQETSLRTLADICRQHAVSDIHFLKIDVEGGEKSVLQGADFTVFRPWVVLVEATAPGTQTVTHEAWEPILLASGYRFLWFDGLNRFYAAEEHHAAIAPHFALPVCVFDDFLRAADTEWTRRITSAEMQAAELLERSMVAEDAIARAEARARDAERRAQDAEMRVQLAEPRLHRLESRAQGAERRSDVAETRLLQAEAKLAVAEAEAGRKGEIARLAKIDADALRASTSWRLTAPLRGVLQLAHRHGRSRPETSSQPVTVAPAPVLRIAPSPRDEVVIQRPDPASMLGFAVTPPVQARAAPATPGVVPARLAAASSTRTVHQFHSGSAVGDAITNAMLLIRRELRALGYRSEIFVEHLDPALAHALRPMAELPAGDAYALILHFSMGFDAFEEVAQLPARKILLYHNITPPVFLADMPGLQHYARLGREQLARLPGRVCAALADSEYNAVELRRFGFDDPKACTLLFDLSEWRGRSAAGPAAAGKPFTMLFVGRIIAAKGQRDLLEAFAIFQERFQHPSRLVLVGREDGAAYGRELRARVQALGLEEQVEITGLIPDDALRARFQGADLYVSLSQHEGFGVPLIEAAAIGLPVLAWPAGAVGFTLGCPEGLLHSLAPDAVAARMLQLAMDAEARTELARAQSETVSRFALTKQIPVLLGALARANVAAPPDPAIRALLANNLRFTVTGHVNGSYSLAAINRRSALALEQARPGKVRLAPVEGVPIDKLDGIPAAEIRALEALAQRPPHAAGPVVALSQHYPILVPDDPGDAALAYVFWEESLLPAEAVATLNTSFRGVLAPSHFVARLLHDSGVSVPVRVVGCAPALDAFFRLPGAAARPAGKTVFLHVSSAFPRKGIDVLLAAYTRAFRASDAVRLVIKTFPNPHNDAHAQVEALRRADRDAPAVELIDTDIDDAAMLRLYESADAMVLPTRGEGFNLPAAEAMAAGLPLIVTGYGGHTDYCADTARLLRFRTAPSRSHLAPPLSLWAEPDAQDLADALRDFHANPSARLAMAQSGRQAAKTAFSAARFAADVEKAALDTLLRERIGRFRLCIVSSWDVRCGVAEYTRALVEAMLSAEPLLDILVLADTRTAEQSPAEPRLRVNPSWTIGAAEAAEDVRREIARADPHLVLIQHHPGLTPWQGLATMLPALSREDRVVAVTLHNTTSIAGLETGQRQAVLCALASATRVILHTRADMNRLQEMGLEKNLVLLPQGVPDGARSRPERTLVERDTITIGSCGFLLPGKGIPTLIQAAGLLKATWPRLKLRLLNADYGSESSRQEAERALAAAHSARMEGAIEWVQDFLPMEESLWRLGECELIVLPYEASKEASSAALRMALSAGPSVAVTPIALFDEAENAVWRLSGHEPEVIAQDLSRILLDQDGRATKRAAAREWMEARHWDKVAARTAGMLIGLYQSR